MCTTISEPGVELKLKPSCCGFCTAHLKPGTTDKGVHRTSAVSQLCYLEGLQL